MGSKSEKKENFQTDPGMPSVFFGARFELFRTKLFDASLGNRIQIPGHREALAKSYREIFSLVTKIS